MTIVDTTKTKLIILADEYLQLPNISPRRREILHRIHKLTDSDPMSIINGRAQYLGIQQREKILKETGNG